MFLVCLAANLVSLIQRKYWFSNQKSLSVISYAMAVALSSYEYSKSLCTMCNQLVDICQLWLWKIWNDFFNPPQEQASRLRKSCFSC